MAEAFNDNDAIPGSVQLLDVFLQDMNALDILQSTESPSKHQSQAATSDSVQTKPVDPAANLLQFPSVQVRSPGKLWPKKKNQTWLRRKEELNRLRQQTEQMETHIAFLLLKREKRWRLPLDSVKEMQWKAAERKLLQNVLRENAILKSQVPAQIQVLTGLQAAVSAVRTPPSPPRATVKGQQLQINTSIFSMLETRVDQRFQDGGGRHKCCDGVQSVQVLPLDDVAASIAIWNIIDVGRMPQKVSQIVRRSEDTYVVKSCFLLRRDQDTYLLAHADSVMKRHTVPEGRIMLGESTTKWPAYRGDSKLWTHESRESVRFVIRRCPLGPSGLLQQFGCQLNAPGGRSKTAKQEMSSETSPSLHVIVMPLYREIIDSQRQFLENWLWDSMRASIN
ncbi:hypothetical protein PC114_g10977 [Phytophthora cactorum]|uniref:Uncharacterized protein n=1 Tax=Phytophthora cactorum TaxID=29920 RepID=A0A8T1DIJ1_9STRA|nr:hypothetical protein PC114_g10977 [Phytophthora cactorum]KAG2940050.1 hypothetical protein PC117_g10710 [Phytophthora cactorum]